MSELTGSDRSHLFYMATVCYDAGPVNLAGVINSIAERREELLKDPRWREQGSIFVNGDPALRLLLAAANDIASRTIEYEVALERCREMATRNEVADGIATAT